MALLSRADARLEFAERDAGPLPAETLDGRDQF
jgi:hypothetical protein